MMKEEKIQKIKTVLLIAVIVGVVVAFRFFGLSDYLSVAKMRGLLEAAGIWAPIAFVALYAIFTSLGFPGTIPTLVGGIIFGKWFGTAYNVLGATLGASGAFFIARFFSRSSLMKKFAEQKWFRKFNSGLEENGLYYMLFIRLVPIFPYNGINFGAGLTKISFRDFFIGTFVGMIPGAFIFTNAGYELGESAIHGFSLTPGMIGAFVLLGLFALVPVAVKRWIEKRKVRKKKEPR